MQAYVEAPAAESIEYDDSEEREDHNQSVASKQPAAEAVYQVTGYVLKRFAGNPCVECLATCTHTGEADVRTNLMY